MATEPKKPNRDPDFSMVSNCGCDDILNVWVDEMIEEYIEHDENGDQCYPIIAELKFLDGSLFYKSNKNNKWIKYYDDIIFPNVTDRFITFLMEKELLDI